jgi:hypothetical protein
MYGLPDRLQAPPPPPPPASGNVERRGLVDVHGPSEALTVGPDEVLVIVCHGTTDRYELQHLRERCNDAGLRPEQILLFGAGFTIAKAPKDNIRITLEGETTDGRQGE